uniref:Uncharacterized protein n=1 Tax=Arundo donax TaxID=35708 RepID=A0A0A9C3B4_ARUDO
MIVLETLALYNTPSSHKSNMY